MTYLVRYSEAHDPNHPAPIRVDSEFWFQWLENVRSFRYECENGNISVIKDDRGYWTASKKVDGSLRRKRLGVSRGITIEKLRDAVNLLCLNSLWNQHLKEQSQNFKNSKQGMQFQVERLELKIADLEGELERVSQRRCDTKRLQRIRTVASKYQSQSTDTPRWYWANKLLADLEKELSRE
jgi:hypothetical protein